MALLQVLSSMECRSGLETREFLSALPVFKSSDETAAVLKLHVHDIQGGRKEFRLQCSYASSVVLLLWFENVDGSKTRWERGISAAELTGQFLLPWLLVVLKCRRKK